MSLADYTRIESLSRRQGPVGTWLAEDPEGRRVVLKCFSFGGLEHWKPLELFEREIALLQTLAHPCIPRVLAHGEDPAALWLVQEWVPGQALDQKLEAGWHPTLAELSDLARQILELLSYLHAHGVIHRDLKPANLILDPLGRLHLIDFGAVASILAPPGGSTVVGTFGYMPPEQFAGRVGPQSDLYALGMSLIHLLSGRRPDELVGDDLLPDWSAHLSLDPDWQAWFEELTQPRQDLRFATADEALASLPDSTGLVPAPRLQPPAVLLEALTKPGGATTCLVHWNAFHGVLWLRHKNTSGDAAALRFGLLVSMLLLAPLLIMLGAVAALIFGESLTILLGAWALSGYALLWLGLLANLGWKMALLLNRREILLDRRFLELRSEGLGTLGQSISLPADRIACMSVQRVLWFRRLRVHPLEGRVRTLLWTSHAKEADDLMALFQWLIVPHTGTRFNPDWLPNQGPMRQNGQKPGPPKSGQGI